MDLRACARRGASASARRAGRAARRPARERHRPAGPGAGGQREAGAAPRRAARAESTRGERQGRRWTTHRRRRALAPRQPPHRPHGAGRQRDRARARRRRRDAARRRHSGHARHAPPAPAIPVGRDSARRAHRPRRARGTAAVGVALGRGARPVRRLRRAVPRHPRARGPAGQPHTAGAADAPGRRARGGGAAAMRARGFALARAALGVPATAGAQVTSMVDARRGSGGTDQGTSTAVVSIAPTISWITPALRMAGSGVYSDHGQSGWGVQGWGTLSAITPAVRGFRLEGRGDISASRHGTGTGTAAPSLGIRLHRTGRWGGMYFGTRYGAVVVAGTSIGVTKLEGGLWGEFGRGRVQLEAGRTSLQNGVIRQGNLSLVQVRDGDTL